MSDHTTQLLTEPLTGEDARLAALHAALVDRASAESAVDVTYRLVDSPVGSLLLAATESGVVRVAFETEGHDRVLESLGSSVGSRILRGGDRLDPLARELDDYFAGRRQGFDIPLDLRLARGFRLTVLRHLGEIPYGSTESYGEVAVASGSPRAVRAVGSACATNPLPIVVPCHRVVRSDGSLGGYLGGLPAKERLLALERAA
ncbi:methylated-DNA--[protein]-cysteine S-methyltransferase [Terrabacter sp. LjRoot27]|uniref:methylated-DNA--[protein]-cysteine S-methyltransferase n=1 Tax=Terrabacter sp. LjRoot27 TaxID=3342306 RepID=UPI003ECD6806